MQLREKLRKAGIKPLLRDATMEEHAALVSYTEFESWWSAIYEGRRQLKAFETPHEHDDVSQATMIMNGSLGFHHHTACLLKTQLSGTLYIVICAKIQNDQSQLGEKLSF